MLAIGWSSYRDFRIPTSQLQRATHRDTCSRKLVIRIPSNDRRTREETYPANDARSRYFDPKKYPPRCIYIYTYKDALFSSYIARQADLLFKKLTVFFSLIDRGSVLACCRNKSWTRSPRGDIFKNTFSPHSSVPIRSGNATHSRVASQLLFFRNISVSREEVREDDEMRILHAVEQRRSRTFDVRFIGWTHRKTGEEFSGRKSHSFR